MAAKTEDRFLRIEAALFASLRGQAYLQAENHALRDFVVHEFAKADISTQKAAIAFLEERIESRFEENLIRVEDENPELAALLSSIRTKEGRAPGKKD